MSKNKKRCNIVKMSLLPNLTYRLHAIIMKILGRFVDINKLNPKFIQKGTRYRISNMILWNKKK